MKISVIIPTYKPKEYIWDCLHSFTTQTLSPDEYEVWFVLNGCNEPYYSDIQSYIDHNLQGRNIHLVQTDQGGVSNARNIGLDRAQGDYITFIDDDDYISPTYLEEMAQLASPDTVVCAYPYAFVNNVWGGEQLKKYSITQAYDYCTAHNTHTIRRGARRYLNGPCMKLIPRAYIGDRRFDVHFQNCEDVLFMFLISDKMKHLTFTSPNAIYYRRFRENSLTTTKRNVWQSIRNSIKCQHAQSKIYFRHLGQYSTYLYITRFCACLKSIYYRLRYGV